MPGNFSALGLLLADVRRDFVRTRLSRTAETSVVEVSAILQELAAEGAEELRQSGFAPERCRFAATLDMRYAGQSFELSIPTTLDPADVAAIEEAFGEIYAARYGATTPAAIEIVSYRVAAWGLTDKPRLPQLDGSGRSVDGARIGTRQVVFDGTAREVEVLDRERLPPGTMLRGPLVIEESGTSTVIPGGWSATLEVFGCLLLGRN